MTRRNEAQLKVRTHDEIRELLTTISPLIATPYQANGRTNLDRTVSASFSHLPDDIDLGLFYGLVTHAPLMVRELLAQLDTLMSELAVAE